MSKKRYLRERTCISCFKVEQVRSDNPAERCAKCGSIDNLKKAWDAVVIGAVARQVECLVCNQKIPPYQIYCSVECKSRAAERVERVCEVCDKKFTLLASMLPPINKTTNARGRFCSRVCYAEWLSGSADRRGIQ